MVFPDLSAPQTQPAQAKSPHAPIAAVGDRMVALVLDFLIFSPVVSLIVAGLVKNARTYFLLDTSSTEGLLIAAMAFIMGFVCVVFLQAAFLFFWQATPGQFFLQMRVISFPHARGRLSLNQCLMRSSLWCLGFAALTLPFLEVLSHPLRRAFHERASDTMVVTLKTVSDAGPLPLESHFISSWLRMSFLLLLFLVGLGFLKSYNGLLLSQYEDKSAPSLYCQELSTAAVKDASRLDAALSLYLLNDLSPACLEKEAEVSLWSATRDDQGLAYLAKYLVSDPSTQKEYLAKLCTEPTSSYCSMALYMSEDRSLENLSVADSQLWVAQVLLAEEKYARADYDGSLRIIESLQKNEILKTSLEKRFVRAVWALQNSSIQKGRTPASVKHNETWIEKFKERYEVP